MESKSHLIFIIELNCAFLPVVIAVLGCDLLALQELLSSIASSQNTLSDCESRAPPSPLTILYRFPFNKTAERSGVNCNARPFCTVFYGSSAIVFAILTTTLAICSRLPSRPYILSHNLALNAFRSAISGRKCRLCVAVACGALKVVTHELINRSPSIIICWLSH